MLRSLKTLEHFSIGATDGAIGKISDFYFDDEAWAIRYVVVDTSAWLGGREVLISPYGFGTPDWYGQLLPVHVTKEQVKNSPGVDTDKPISRQYERSYSGYYGYPDYWGGAGVWGESSMPRTQGGEPEGTAYRGFLKAPSKDGDPHLRSCKAVKGSHVHASDGAIGHVQGFVIDDKSWSIRYLVLNTSNWWVGHEVLVSPEWIQAINWPESTVTTNLDREAIMASPAYDGTAILNRAAELVIYNHYDRNGYWQEKSPRAAA